MSEGRIVGMWLILIALFAMWLQATGRLKAVWNAIATGIDPLNPAAGGVSGTSFTQTAGKGGSGGKGSSDPNALEKAYACSQDPSVSCVQTAWKSLNSVSDWETALKGLFSGPFKAIGIKL